MPRLQRALSLIYPDQCALCPELVEETGGLCAECWRDTHFIRGLVCESCGASLPGADDSGVVFCDDCLVLDRPWAKGRAAISYRDAGCRFVLALKHGDRPDLAETAATWMARAGSAFWRYNPVLVPIPIHWSRLLRRRYNQSAELARALAKHTGLDYGPDALVRTRRTPVQDGLDLNGRFANLEGALAAHSAKSAVLRGRAVCLIDDVMTSGATFSVAARACHDAGASRVFVLALARVEKAT